MTATKLVTPLVLILMLLPSCSLLRTQSQKPAPTTAPPSNIAQGLYNHALALQQAGQLKKAEKGFRDVFSKHPLSPLAGEAAYQYAQTLERQGELLDAFEAYHSVITKYPASDHYAQSIKRQEIIAHQVAQGHITSSFIGFKSRIDISRTTAMLAKVRDNAPRAASADKAQFTIGEVHQTRSSGDTGMVRAMDAYRQLTRDYPDSPYAAESQYRIGHILLSQAKDGNQDAANLDRAKKALDDVLIRYPKSTQAKLAKTELTKLASGDIQRSFDLAEFYRKKNQNTSALFYYQEAVRKSAPGPLRSQAQAWIQHLSAP